MREIKFRAYHPETNKMLFDGSEWKFRVGTHLIEKVITVLHYGVMHNVPAGGNHDYVKVVDKEGQASNYYSNWDYEAVYQSVEIMQYVGLKDSKGVEIYEGDIVASPHFTDAAGRDHKLHHLVEWSSKYHGWYLRNLTTKDGSDDGCIMIFVVRDPVLEVVGNIHQNPSLLQDKGEA